MGDRVFMKSVILLSHGSQSQASQAEVAELARKIAREGSFAYVQYAYLGSAEPLFLDAVGQLVQRGALEIVVLLHFLNSGNHVAEDVPALLAAAERQHPAVKFLSTQPAGLHPALPALCFDLIQNAQPFSGGSHAQT